MTEVAAPAIDRQGRGRAEGWISELAQLLREAELRLATLSGFCGETTLGRAVVGAMGIRVGEAAQQLPTLRQAVRDMEEVPS